MRDTAFEGTFGRLLADRAGATLSVVVIGTLLLAAWGWWAIRAPITLYEVSGSARVELDASTSPVQSPIRGRVVSANLRVGRQVLRGDVLVEIDPVAGELQLRQEQVRAQGLLPEIGRLREQIASEELARREEQSAALLNADEAASRTHEAEARAQFAAVELARMEKLHAAGLIPPRDLDRARSEVTTLQAAVSTARSAALRVPVEQATRDRERDVRIQHLLSEISAFESERRTLDAGMQRLAYELERHRVRATVDGTIAESALLRPGAVVQEGERLASIVPTSQLIVAAQYPADRALGRIRPGQSANLRLEGLPWAEFGAVPATVSRVAREVRDGWIRVELTLEPAPGFRGRLEHGMPGTVEIAVERLTPLWLVLRASGQLLTERR